MNSKIWIFASAALLMWLGGCDSELPTGLNLPVPGSGDGSVIGGGNDEGNDDDPTNDSSEQPGEYSGGEDNTFSHYDDLSAEGGKDPFELLAQRQEEGPPEIRTRLHSCQKVQIAALRNILSNFGVDLGAQGNPDPAGELLADGADALGGSNYASRTGEALTWTNSGATKFQDIFVQAAPEIIAALPNVEHCQIEGVGPEVFNADDECNEDAITCLIGKPATEDHVAICNHIVESASDIDTGKAIAVAAMLAAAHTCE